MDMKIHKVTTARNAARDIEDVTREPIATETRGGPATALLQGGACGRSAVGGNHF